MTEFDPTGFDPLSSDVSQEDAERFYRDNYGIGLEEVSQEVAWGSYKGTVAQMIADKVCPVGHVLREAYRDQGIEGVQEKFYGFSLLDKNFKVEFSRKTLAAIDEVKKKKSLALRTS